MLRMKVTLKPDINRLAGALEGVDWVGVKRQIAETIAFQIERYAKQATPVDTGRLRASIVVSSPGGGKSIRTTIGPHVKYAGWIHSGRMYRSGRLVTIRGRGKAGTPIGGMPFMRIGTNLALAKLSGIPVASRLHSELRRNLRELRRIAA